MFLPLLGDFDDDERAGELAGDLQNTILDECNGLTFWPLSGRLASPGSPGRPDSLVVLQGTTWSSRSPGTWAYACFPPEHSRIPPSAIDTYGAVRCLLPPEQFVSLTLTSTTTPRQACLLAYRSSTCTITKAPTDATQKDSDARPQSNTSHVCYPSAQCWPHCATDMGPLGEERGPILGFPSTGLPSRPLTSLSPSAIISITLHGK